MIVFGYFICSLGLIILGPLSFVPIEPSMPMIIISLVITGFGMSAKLVCSFVDAINNSIDGRGMPNDVGTYGLVSAVFFTSCSIGASIGPSAGGFLLEHFDYRPSTIVVFAIETFMVSSLQVLPSLLFTNLFSTTCLDHRRLHLRLHVEGQQ